MSPARAPELGDRAWLVQKYQEEGLSLEQVGSLINRSAASVYNALRDHGIPLRTAWDTMRRQNYTVESSFPELNDDTWLREKYIDKQMDQEEIAKLLGCSRTLIGRYLRRYGIPVRLAGVIRPNHRRRDMIPELQDPVWLRDQRIAQAKSPGQIADLLGCSPKTVETWLKRHGIRKKDPLPRGEALQTAAPRTQKTSTGYTNRWSPDHPAANHRGFVLEHRLVAEDALGRELTDQEVVHHLNYQTRDNREDNFIVFPDNGTHKAFEANPPDWVPRCPCCGRPTPEKILSRPPGIPLIWDPNARPT